MNLIVMNNPVHISIVIETFKTNPNIILIYIYILNIILKFAALNYRGHIKTTICTIGNSGHGTQTVIRKEIYFVPCLLFIGNFLVEYVK